MKFLFSGGFWGAMASCNYKLQKMLLNILIKQTVKNMLYWFRRMQWYTDVGSQDPENLWWNPDFSPKMMKMFYSLVINTSSMKHHLTETHEHNFEIHNIASSSQSISLKSDHRKRSVSFSEGKKSGITICGTEKVSFWSSYSTHLILVGNLVTPV